MAKLGPVVVVAAVAAATVTVHPDIRVTPLGPSFDPQSAGIFSAAGAPPPAAGGSSFTIVNDGNSDLVVTSLDLDLATPGIEWSPTAPFTVGPGRSQRVYVTIDWHAAPSGAHQRRLLVGSNDPNENPYPGGVPLNVRGLGDCSLATGGAPLSGGSTGGDDRPRDL